MSLAASLINVSLKLSGIKKMYNLPDDEFLKKVEKMNKSRGFYIPKDNKAIYKEHDVLGYHCLIIQLNSEPADCSILYMFGGGMMIGPDKGDIDVIVKLAKKTGCDIWFPIYPLCTEHCITESFEMIYECYRQMIEIYGANNVSTCGFSSGGALALGIATYNNAQSEKLPMPRHKYTVRQRPGLFHCYAMLPYFKEAKEDFDEIAEILKN